jgi:very-short-patch-repair endonuclease
MTPLNALARYAARQHHVVSRAELLSLGWSEDGIRHLVAAERLFRIHRGVYVVGRRDLTREGRWMAAVLACPTGAALSHLSAAVLWELLERDSPRPHVLVPAAASNRGLRGIHVHRSSDFTEEEVEVRDAIRATTPLRTLVDLSRGPLPSPSLNAAVRQAARLHHVDLQQLRGIRRLEPIVRLYDPLAGLTESDFEVIFLEMCKRFRLPPPVPQFRFGEVRADFAWPLHRVAVECQSRRWHANDVNYVTDRRKARVIRAAGFELLPFTWAEVRYEPAAVAAEIRATLDRQAQLLAL